MSFFISHSPLLSAPLISSFSASLYKADLSLLEIGIKILLLCLQTLKLVRHPCILKYIDVVETERHLKLITEDVVPLSNQIHCLETFEIISGLYNVLEALIFLHEKVYKPKTDFVFYFLTSLSVLSCLDIGKYHFV